MGSLQSCDFKQSSEYMESLCVYFTLAETAKMQDFNDAMTREWLEDFGRAYYLHRANATLTDEVNNYGRKLKNKLMGFSPSRQKALKLSLGCRGIILPVEIWSSDANGAAQAAPIFFAIFGSKPPDRVLTSEMNQACGYRNALFAWRLGAPARVWRCYGRVLAGYSAFLYPEEASGVLYSDFGF